MPAEKMHGRHPDIRVVITEQVLHQRRKRWVRAIVKRLNRRSPDLGGRMIQKRFDRFCKPFHTRGNQHIQRINHLPFVPGRQGGPERANHRGLRNARPEFVQIDLPVLKRLSEAIHIGPADPEQQPDPYRNQGHGEKAQITVGDAQRTGKNQNHRGPQTGGQVVHGGVQKHLGPLLQIGRHRKKENLNGRFVNGMAEADIPHFDRDAAEKPRNQQHPQAAGSQAYGQENQGDTHTVGSENPGSQQKLKQEGKPVQIGKERAEECGLGVLGRKCGICDLVELDIGHGRHGRHDPGHHRQVAEQVGPGHGDQGALIFF